MAQVNDFDIHQIDGAGLQAIIQTSRYGYKTLTEYFTLLWNRQLFPVSDVPRHVDHFAPTEGLLYFLQRQPGAQNLIPDDGLNLRHRTSCARVINGFHLMTAIGSDGHVAWRYCLFLLEAQNVILIHYRPTVLPLPMGYQVPAHLKFLGDLIFDDEWADLVDMIQVYLDDEEQCLLVRDMGLVKVVGLVRGAVMVRGVVVLGLE